MKGFRSRRDLGGDVVEGTSRMSVTQIVQRMDEHSKRITDHGGKTLAILFSDVAGSTRYFERFGDVEGRRMIQRLTDVVMPVIKEEQGRVVKTIGDAVMAVFDSAQQAAVAAIKMQRLLREVNARLERNERMQIRVGINYGAVLADKDGDVYGDSVNVAARVQAKARAGEILVSQAVKEALAAPVPSRAIGSFSLKGKSQPIELHEIIWGPRRSRGSPRAAAVIATALALAGAGALLYWTRPWTRARSSLTAPQEGHLSLVTTPECTVKLDGKTLGRTPLNNVPVPAGTLALVLEANGKRYRFSALVHAGKPTSARVRLSDLPAIR